MMIIQAPSQYPIHTNLTISALPNEADFALMADQGYEIVISLCRSMDSVTLEDEDALVSDAGMKYIHLPVDFYDPRLADYELLRDILTLFHDKKVWLHCAKNYRVSAFMFIYNVVNRSMDVAKAREISYGIWEPNEQWQELMDEALEKYAYQHL